MKALVLSCSTGQGHNVAAHAIAEEFVARGIECVAKDVLEFADHDNVPMVVKDYLVKDAYDDLVMKHPQIFRGAFAVGEHLSASKHRSPIYFANSTYAGNLGAYLTHEGIDTVLCTHMFPAQALTDLIADGMHVKSYAVATDYLCLPFWEECRMDAYLVSHPDVVSEFVQRGIPESKVVALGLPIARAFREPPSKARARESLGLAEDSHVYLILTGSMGFGHIDDVPEMILAADDAASIVVVTGHNEELLALLEKRYADEPQLRALGYIDDTMSYMNAADVVLSKPGGLSSTEVAALGRPLVHTPAIPGFEARNAIFFHKHGMAVSASDEPDAAALALELVRDGRRAQEMCDAQRRNVDAYASARIFDYVAARSGADGRLQGGAQDDMRGELLPDGTRDDGQGR